MCGLCGCRFLRCWRDLKQIAGERETVLAGGAGEQAVVPDAMEASGQGVQQEAADELVGGKGHDLLPIGAAAAVVLVAEGDPGLVEPSNCMRRLLEIATRWV